ncbi:MAG TPA: DUF421 domain-containing protein [Bacilli bacterium]|nr:DUF421 domain-containing protein [Bacilli bacterium]
MLEEILGVAGRALLSLFALFLVTKMLGKKQVSQLSLFDYVIGISIGNFAAEMTINTESFILNGIVAVLIFGLIAYLVSVVTIKSIVLRRYFMGIPTVLIEHGTIIKKNLKKVKFDINDMLEECRGNGYFNLEEIEYAIMEANGKLSILPTSEYSPVIKKDLKLKNEKVGLCSNIIIDGKIMRKNLENCGKDEKWLLQQLKIKGKDVKIIMLATLDINEKLNIYMDSKNYTNVDLME